MLLIFSPARCMPHIFHMLTALAIPRAYHLRTASRGLPVPDATQPAGAAGYRAGIRLGTPTHDYTWHWGWRPARPLA